MKKTIVFILLLINTGLLIGQNLIIGDPVLSGNSIPFTDTTALFGNCDCYEVNYEIDLDGDENYDVDFQLEYCCGGPYEYKYVYVKTINNNFSVHIDTNYQAPVPVWDTVNNDWVYELETYTVIKKYTIGDTIFHNGISSTGQNINLFYSSWNDVNGVWLHIKYIGQFYSDTSYIAFTKNIEDSTSLYYIKVFLNTSGLHLISAKSNGSPSKIDELNTNPIHFYPNPVVNTLYLKESYEEYKIYTTQGLLVYSGKIIENQNTIDLSHLKSGYYILKLKNNSKEAVTKFIKK